MQHHAADELDVEVPHAQHAAAGFADERERVGQQVVERFALVGAAAEIVAALAQAGVGERRQGALALADGGDEGTQALELALVLRADDFGEEGVENHGIGLVCALRGGTTIQRLYLIGRRVRRVACLAVQARNVDAPLAWRGGSAGYSGRPTRSFRGLTGRPFAHTS